MIQILKKEINSFLNSLVAYLVIAVFLTGIGLLMWVFPDTSVLNYGYADMSTLFTLSPYVFMFLIPAITMRSFAEEKKGGTLELLFTRPLTATDFDTWWRQTRANPGLLVETEWLARNLKAPEVRIVDLREPLHRFPTSIGRVWELVEILGRRSPSMKMSACGWPDPCTGITFPRGQSAHADNSCPRSLSSGTVQ